jgi:hypothetical protein
MLGESKGYQRQVYVGQEWEYLPIIDFVVVGGRSKDVDPFRDG